jgi:uncharacterized membrane protein
MMLLAAGWLLRLIGRFHPTTTHFPIAFLLAAAGLELLSIVRRKAILPDAAFLTLGLGAAGALLSALLGWADAASLRFDPEDAGILAAHRWLGTFTAASSTAAGLLLAVQRTGRLPKGRPIIRALLFASALSVGVGAHFGGILVYGHDYFSSALAGPPTSGATSPGPAPSGEVRFDPDIRAIFEKNCVRCHGAEKQKARLRLDSLESVQRGGKSGPAVRPNDPAHSPLVRAITDPDPATRMPQQAPPLPADLIDRIRAWIDQGAR